MIDKTKLHNDLTAAFINYQWRLENPMPAPGETQGKIADHYNYDYMFRKKVDSMACHTMFIFESHLKGEG
jgi:hypothetical protein